MKKIVFLLLILVIFGFCGCKDHADELYFNRKGVIVEMNGKDETFTQDKFHEPVTCGLVLIQDVIDTTMFMELSGCNSHMISTEWYYNHEIGDSVHFDYIRKNRYFHIYPKK